MKGRKLMVNGQKWMWRLGRAYVVAHNGTKKYVAHASEVKQVSPDIWLRGQHKRTTDGRLTPANVAKWIKSLEEPNVMSR